MTLQEKVDLALRLTYGVLLAEPANHISTHHETCYREHAACFAELIRGVLDGES